jgi:putative ABC transport system substrate-binding protein
MMRRRAFCAGIGAGLLATLARVQAQHAGKLPRIGLLVFGAAPSTGTDVFLQAFMEGLREHGYVERRTLIVERRYADGNVDRVLEHVAELAQSHVDALVVAGPGPLEAARKATQTIPLVMLASSADPVGEGIVQSLARPGGNITGLTYAVSVERFGKQLELLKLAAGSISRLAVLWDFDIAVFRRSWEAPLNEAARLLGVEVQAPTVVRDAQQLPAAFAEIRRQRSDAVLIATSGAINAARAQVAQLAIANRLPAIAAFKVFPHAGLAAVRRAPRAPPIRSSTRARRRAPFAATSSRQCACALTTGPTEQKKAFAGGE